MPVVLVALHARKDAPGVVEAGLALLADLSYAYENKVCWGWGGGGVPTHSL